ncbi:hypothetical protein BpHYR1_047769 [Brachionus plicatilis]|uniref:Uncharacterized protein n=1 Tax=Brachionus plicatilis TaxID=10195 RepID=A0A3M7T8N8_BRAPC|nr:hypothetical protein BpHYR1_047769 [Brachionus plicatilis]
MQICRFMVDAVMSGYRKPGYRPNHSSILLNHHFCYKKIQIECLIYAGTGWKSSTGFQIGEEIQKISNQDLLSILILALARCR